MKPEAGDSKDIQFPESDGVFESLRNFSENYQGHFLVMGGVGVQGTIGFESRIVKDLDLFVPKTGLENAIEVLKELHFNNIESDKSDKRLAGSGVVMVGNVKGKETTIDIVSGDLNDKGLYLHPFGGELFIPSRGLNFPVSLRGIDFNTMSPEVHFLLKNRATRRLPMQTLNPLYNRRKDMQDLKELEKIINKAEIEQLVHEGMAFTGKHPMLVEISRRVQNLKRKKQ
jgi:hypothetical protein